MDCCNSIAWELDTENKMRRRKFSPRSVIDIVDKIDHALSIPRMKQIDEESTSYDTIDGGNVECSTFPGAPFLQDQGFFGIRAGGSVDPFLRQGSAVAVLIWVTGLLFAYTFSPVESFERLEGIERNSLITVVILLLYTNFSRGMHYVLNDNIGKYSSSGIMVGSLTVQSIAISSMLLMLTFPTPVLVDPITGLRCHLVRWAEWTALGFLMTFLTESVDLPLQRGRGAQKTAWLHGITMGVSCSAGALLGFCATWKTWLSVFTVSWVLYLSIFVRMYQRYMRVRRLSKGTSLDEKEEYSRAMYSLKTIIVCAITWTGLVVSYSVIAFAGIHEEDSILSREWLVLATENVFETISKVWYASLLIEIHSALFDDGTKAMRRLEELRNVLNTVWDNSSDLIVWSSKKRGIIEGVISPTFFNLQKSAQDGELASKQKTLLVELDPASGGYRTSTIDMSKPITREEAVRLASSSPPEAELGKAAQKNLSIITDLLLDVHTSSLSESTMMKTLIGDGDGEGNFELLRFEAQITKHSPSTLLVLRNVSARFQRFEAEKKLIAEMTARRKDAEANRFTRHEVKNGILAAIGVLDSMRDVGGQGRRYIEETSLSDMDTDSINFDEGISELDSTLRDVLDTIMDHAMSREVIYGEYQIRKERVVVPDVIDKSRGQSKTSNSRFTLRMSPSTFPTLGLDPRLLRYIYQNALSNACRYGLATGSVDTSISYDPEKKEFKMEVVNLPGPGHDGLVSMKEEEVSKKVFSPGTRLHGKLSPEGAVSVLNSSGDGAWIMKQCAKMMKGDCNLKFEKDRTVFSFWCPARHFGLPEEVETHRKLECLPENTWGIVIDDSKIQRKLMERFLRSAGISKDRQVIVGEDSKEIYGFIDQVVSLVQSNPNDKFLVIADENLDVVEGTALHDTVSGSLCVQHILENLDPPDNARVLGLVRSANDSHNDVELYTKRAHGYILKAPIDKKGVLGSIEPWWFSRFAPTEDEKFQSAFANSDSLASIDYDPYYDIKAALEVVDALCVSSIVSLRKRWRSIKDKLLTLKGDLKATVSSAGEDGIPLIKVVAEIDSLLKGDFPEDLSKRWANLRAEINNVLDNDNNL